MWIMLTIWVIIALFTIIVEVETMELVSIWFSIGAIISGMLACAGASITAQIIAFFITSSILFLICWIFWRDKLKKDFIPTNIDRNVGKIVNVVEKIDGNRNPGVVMINGQLWEAHAQCEDIIDTGEKVKISSIKGNKVFVIKEN